MKKKLFFFKMQAPYENVEMDPGDEEIDSLKEEINDFAIEQDDIFSVQIVGIWTPDSFQRINDAKYSMYSLRGEINHAQNIESFLLGNKPNLFDKTGFHEFQEAYNTLSNHTKFWADRVIEAAKANFIAEGIDADMYHEDFAAYAICDWRHFNINALMGTTDYIIVAAKLEFVN